MDLSEVRDGLSGIGSARGGAPLVGPLGKSSEVLSAFVSKSRQPRHVKKCWPHEVRLHAKWRSSS